VKPKRKSKPLLKPEPPLRVYNRLQWIEDPEGAFYLFDQMLRAVRMAAERCRGGKREERHDPAA
jgi:hypothetical protein